jgi:tRNA modification GTPase
VADQQNVWLKEKGLNLINMATRRDPIVAIATSTGKAGVGVVRISGDNLSDYSLKLFDTDLKPRHATLIDLLDEDKTQIDQGLAIFYPAPHSYTGEDVIEFQGHGGTVVLQMVLKRLLEVGRNFQLRIAGPGEFTERAFLNGKIDLAQAEAIADLIDASTTAAVKSANRSLVGEFSKNIDHLVDALTKLRILVEATLDFPEEEIEFLENEHAVQQWKDITTRLATIIAASKQGSLLREGAQVVLAGEPNVGKSSLLNALSGSEVAIVTPIAGTTRDRIKEHIQINGIPLHVIDTAGLRESIDEVEKIGIERSWESINSADLILFIRDATKPNDESSELLYQKICDKAQKNLPIIQVWNKLDQCGELVVKEGFAISAKTQQGLEKLKQEILRQIGWQENNEDTIFARQRHIDALARANEHLVLAGQHLQQGNASLELAAEELRLSQEALGEITGKLLADDLLGKIFTSFCIGK